MITKNLSRKECACKCGCGQDTVDYELAIGFQAVCDEISKIMKHKCIAIVHCVNRCPKHNIEEGGKPNSLHVKSKAIDFHVKDFSIDKLYYTAVNVLDNAIYDIVKYDWGIHLEVDPK